MQIYQHYMGQVGNSETVQPVDQEDDDDDNELRANPKGAMPAPNKL